MKSNIELFYYDVNMGEYDEYNPRYVFSDKNNRKALTDIINNKTIEKEYLKKLLNIDAVRINNGKVMINFPIFLKEDLETIELASDIVANAFVVKLELIWDKIKNIVSKLNNGFTDELNMYHIICGGYFDGECFDYLSEHNIISSSLTHPSKRNYIIIGYEDEAELMKWNDGLLCSYNNFYTSKYRFSSFGNGLGNRMDLFRYMRLKEMGNVSAMYDEVHQVLNKYSESEIVRMLDDYITGNDKQMGDVLSLFGYVNEGELKVPLYTKDMLCVINELYAFLNEELGGYIIEKMNEMYDMVSSIYVMQLGLDKSIIMNELWHMLFGTINEILVQKGMVSKPDFYEEQGRYLQSIWEK